MLQLLLSTAAVIFCSCCCCLFHVLRLLSLIFLSIVVLVRKGKDNKAEIVIIDHGLYETLQHRWYKLRWHLLGSHSRRFMHKAKNLFWPLACFFDLHFFSSSGDTVSDILHCTCKKPSWVCQHLVRIPLTIPLHHELRHFPHFSQV